MRVVYLSRDRKDRERARQRGRNAEQNIAIIPLFPIQQEEPSSSSRKSKKEKKKKMQCDECNEDLVGTYFEKDGKNICEKDYEVGVPFQEGTFFCCRNMPLKFVLNHESRRRSSCALSHILAGIVYFCRVNKRCLLFAEVPQEVQRVRRVHPRLVLHQR